MKKLIIIIGLMLTPLMGKTQYNPMYGYGLRFGCGDDLDFTFTGNMLIVGGTVTYFYGNQIYPYATKQQLSQNKINDLQTIGISLIVTGVVILIEESIRHSSHRRR